VIRVATKFRADNCAFAISLSLPSQEWKAVYPSILGFGLTISHLHYDFAYRGRCLRLLTKVY
jgi:hypothetical protein